MLEVSKLRRSITGSASGSYTACLGLHQNTLHDTSFSASSILLETPSSFKASVSVEQVNL